MTTSRAGIFMVVVIMAIVLWGCFILGRGYEKVRILSDLGKTIRMTENYDLLQAELTKFADQKRALQR